MQVRVFESKDMTSGLKKIRQELGPDALILSTKTVRSNNPMTRGQQILEITAAIDDLPVNSFQPFNDTRRSLGSATPALHTRKKSLSRNSSFRQVVDDNLEEFLHKQPATDSAGSPLLSQEIRKNVLPRQGRLEHEEPCPAPDNGELYDEVRQLRSLINGLSEQLEEAISRKRPQKNIEVDMVRQKTQKKTSLQQNPLLRHLLDKGIQPETARTLANFLKENYDEEELLDECEITEKLIETIRNLIEVAPPQFKNSNKQQRIAFVGPTGVGKTTTLAKVCAHYLATKSKSVALITIDTYRIAAVEQLKIYGEIMGLPVDVVFTPEQMQEALARHHDKELILIDTAGRSPRDPYNIDELASFLTPEMEVEKHLVLSAATREAELLHTIDKFRNLKVARTVFTKLDECFTLGILLNVQLQNPAPLSWLTNGQRVPEDLLHISPEKVAELIMTDGNVAETA